VNRRWILAAVHVNPYVILVMPDQIQMDAPLQISRLKGRQLFIEIINGIAITAGMALLWALENVRNVFFRLLDRANLKPRAGRASAFPPGRPRKLKAPPFDVSRDQSKVG
jgi:hypothetical protein